MTVAELIEKLREMPQDAVVAVPYEFGVSDMNAAEDVTLKRGKRWPIGDTRSREMIEEGDECFVNWARCQPMANTNPTVDIVFIE